MKIYIKNLTVVLSLIFIILFYNNCQPLDSKKDTRQNLNAASEGGGGTVIGNPIAEHSVKFSEFQTQEVLQNEPQISICLFKVYFSEGKGASEDYSINIGRIDLKPEGTALGVFDLPEGQYNKVEFIGKGRCEDKYSVSVFNQNGMWQTQEDIELKFYGNFHVGAKTQIVLEVQGLADMLGEVNNDEQIVKAFKSFQGTIAVR